MKICIFTETFYPVVGGGETQARILAENLIRQGHDAFVLTRRTDRSLQVYERVGGIGVHRLAPTGRGQLKKWGLALSSVLALVRLRFKYDLVFVSGYRIIGMAAVPVSRLLGKVCVLKADSQGEMSGEFFRAGLLRLKMSPDSPFFRMFLHLRNRILKKAQAFTAISAEIAAEFIAAGIPENKIHRIPNSVDTIRFAPSNPEQKTSLRRKLEISQTASVAVYTGRLVSYKGLPLLLKVWREVCTLGREVQLLLVGTGGLDIHNCEEQLKAYVAAQGLDPFVRFTGSVANVEDFLQASDFFTFPTENDAFPSSLIEAMSCCLPVITTPVGAIGEIVTDRENGLVVQPGDFGQLYSAIETLIDDPELALRLGEAGHRKVQENYSEKIVSERYISLFLDSLSTSRSPLKK